MIRWRLIRCVGPGVGYMYRVQSRCLGIWWTFRTLRQETVTEPIPLTQDELCSIGDAAYEANGYGRWRHSFGAVYERALYDAGFAAGRASRDAEVAELKAELAEAKRGDPDGHLVAVYQVLRPDGAVSDLYDSDGEPRYELVVREAKAARKRVAELERARDHARKVASEAATKESQK